MRYTLGVDLGQQADPTAIVLTEHRRIIDDQNITHTPSWDQRPKKIRNTYLTRLIERPPLGTSYLEVVDTVTAIMQRPDLIHETQLLVDATGVGMPVLELMHQRELNPIGVWISPGDNVVATDYGYRVPKKDLATVLQLVFQSRRIQVARRLELASTMARELQTFRVHTNQKNGNQQWAAWRVGEHDDIVLAQAIVLWYMERVFDQDTMLEETVTVGPDWNPLDY